MWKEINNSQVQFVFKDDDGEEVNVTLDEILEGGTPINTETEEDLEFLRVEVFT